MTKTTTDAKAGVQPWVIVGEPNSGFLDTPEAFLSPGALARWQREEAAIRAEEQRKETERQDRADARQELTLWSARQHALAHGHAWDPQQPFKGLAERHRPSQRHVPVAGP